MTVVRAVGWLLIVSCVSGIARGAEPNTLTEAELADGWILLFDGETTFGWQATSKADWKVADGAIAVASGEQGFLCTTSEFADFQLQLDFRAPTKTNSGVFLRTTLAPKDPTKDCYELNIANPEESPFPTGSFVGRQKVSEYKPNEDWQHYDVTAQGGRFVIKLDGKTVMSYTDQNPVWRGRIGLQFRTGPVEFRNIKLKPLLPDSLFNGKDLSGWKAPAEQASVFSVAKPGELNVVNGKGQLESEQQFGDFILQWEVFSAGKHLNSGVFFRCIPGSPMNGYECQIQNGYKDGDRTKPMDGGTGGFYRRQNARRVLGDDFTWVPMTLVVSGNHMAAWVRGIQVSDWTDERPAHENPRQGSRTAAGTLMLQGHDPTTNLSFRKLQAGIMLPRDLPKQ